MFQYMGLAQRDQPDHEKKVGIFFSYTIRSVLFVLSHVSFGLFGTQIMLYVTYLSLNLSR
jgi:hypothetical protein